MGKKQNLKMLGRMPSNSSAKVETAYRKTILKNGIRVVTEEIPHVRSLSLGIWIETGSKDESREKNGISHFIEHMVFKGTKKRNVRDIAQSVESVGGYLNAFTGKEHTCYYARVLDENLELALDVLSDMVFHPTFPAKELNKEKNVILEELKQAEDDPDDIIHDYFEKAIYKDHALGMSVIGTTDTISSIQRNDLCLYRESRYTPSRIVIAGAGMIDHEVLINLVEKYIHINTTHDQKIMEKRTSIPIPDANLVLEEYYKPIQQAHICLGTHGFSVKDEKRYELQVLNTLLGDGMSSRLFQHIRERYGFAYAVYSFNNMMKESGTTGVYIGTDDVHVQTCIELVWKELKSLRKDGITKQELERAKAQLKGSLMLGLENIPNRMIRLGGAELYFGEFIPLETIISRINNVTRDEVQEIADQIFREDRFSTIIIHPDISKSSNN
jgi:predicted Zn-dependent peptidase